MPAIDSRHMSRSYLDRFGSVDILFLDLDDGAVAGKGLEVHLLEVTHNHQLAGLILDVLPIEGQDILLSEL